MSRSAHRPVVRVDAVRRLYPTVIAPLTATPSAGLGGTLGVATETDQAVAFARTKQRAVGVATETSTAVAVTPPLQ